MEEKKYLIILVDPPWRYDFSKTKNREIENHYPTMSLEDICALQVPSADNSVLSLWVTVPKDKEGHKVMEAWGFEYKSMYVWDKEIIGMGFWARGQHELLKIGTKGKFSPPPPDKRPRSILRQRRGRHSAKPGIFREGISEWYPEVSKLELFAREKTPGWDCWGNEIESDIILVGGGGSVKVP